MKARSNNEAFRLGRVEAQNLSDALEMFPGAITYLHPILSADAAELSFGNEGFLNRQCAWFAEAQGRFIGLAILSIDSPILAHLRYLHVVGDVSHHAPARMALAEVAIRKAWDAGCLKLIVHAHIPALHLTEYMHGLGFEFSRTCSSDNERVLEFYRNLYEAPRSEGSPTSLPSAARESDLQKSEQIQNQTV